MQAFLSGGKPREPRKVADADAAPESENKLIPWVEKYRPKRVEDIAFQDEVVQVLKKCLDGADLPNLLFYGPPGTGKTSAILAVAKELFGPDARPKCGRVLELNASDERGIQVVREKVKKFAQQAVGERRSDGKLCPPLKLIILDEADSMTSAAQAALRRIMEKESRTTRFCLICNYISRIIDPLTSRCAKFRFKPLSVSVQTERLKLICDNEKVSINDETLKALLDACEGDLRKSITYLQSAARFRMGEEITQSDIAELTGVVPNPWIERIMKSCTTGSYESVQETTMQLLREGYPAYQVVSQILDVVIVDPDLTDLMKAIICDRLGVVEKRLLDGADEYLQLMDLFCVIMAQQKKL